MSPDVPTEEITAALEKGIRETFENRDVVHFRKAAIEAYRLRTDGNALVNDVQIAHHVFPSDVEQTVQLSLRIFDSEQEKASILMKGALDQVLNRLSFIPGTQWTPKSPKWKFWDRTGQ